MKLTYKEYREKVEYYLANQWVSIADNDRGLIQQYYNEEVITKIPKGEPLLKCATCSSSWYIALKVSMNFFAYNDKKELEKQNELNKQGSDLGGDNNVEVAPVKAVNKKSSKKSV